LFPSVLRVWSKLGNVWEQLPSPLQNCHLRLTVPPAMRVDLV